MSYAQAAQMAKKSYTTNTHNSNDHDNNMKPNERLNEKKNIQFSNNIAIIEIVLLS